MRDKSFSTWNLLPRAVIILQLELQSLTVSLYRSSRARARDGDLPNRKRDALLVARR